MPTDSGYSNQKKKGISQFETVHSMGSSSYGKSVIQKAPYVKTSPLTVVSVLNILGVTGQVEFWELDIGAHSASVGDIVRFSPTASSLPNFEFEIMSVPSATEIRILPMSDSAPVPGDVLSAMGWVGQKVNDDGTPIVSVVQTPIQINIDGVPTEISVDTAVPANTIPVPVVSLDSAGVIVSPLTDTELRASPVPVSGPLTDTQLRASAVPVSAAALPLPSGAATEAKQDTGNSSLSSIDTKLTSPLTTKISDGTDVCDVVQLGVQLTSSDKGLVTNTVIHGLNSGGGGTYVDVKVTPSGAMTVEAEITSSVLPTGASTLAEQQAQSVLVGSVTETAPGTDTASSGLNGRLQRIAQRLTSLIALLPTSLGQKTMANSLAVTLPSDQSAIPVTQTPTSVAGTISSARIGVGLSGVRATVSGAAPNAARKLLMIKPSKNNTGTIYIGASGVASTTGLEIIGPDRLSFEFDAGDYYLISDTAAQEVDILEKV
jgi:hypothetical protein